MLLQLCLMKTKLVEEAFAQITASHAGRIELLNYLQCFLEVSSGEPGLICDRGSFGLLRGSHGSRSVS